MSRFNLAVTILVANASLNNAFLPSRIAATSSRSFAPFKVRSYLDSLSQQPKSVESTMINVEESISTIMAEELKELKELTLPKEDEVVPVQQQQQLSKETPKEDPSDAVTVAVAAAAIDLDLELDQPVAETAVKEVEQLSIETPVESEAATAAVAAAAVIQEESKPEPEDTDTDIAQEPCDDEKISFTIAAAATSTLGVNTSRNYRTTRQTLRESRGKNEKRLSRSTYEKEKSSDKITAIRAKADEQIKNVERDLEGKLVDIQGSFESEMTRITSLLASQVQIEASREEKIRALRSELEGAIVRKNSEIEKEDKITAEMMEVRSKLKTGNISKQLDELIVQKRQVAEFDQAQLKDLIDFVQAAETILQDTTDRTNRIQMALGNISDVDILRPSAATYDFSEFEELERMWDEAAKNAEAENSKIIQLKSKFDDELLNKVLLLGEEIPEYLKAAATRVAIKKEAAAQVAQVVQQREISSKAASYVEASSEKSIQAFSDSDTMDTKDDYELFGIVAKSLSSAAIDSAKAGVFGLKAVFETVQEKDFSEKMPSDKDLEEDQLKAIGNASKTIASNVRNTASATQANQALRETGNDLGSVFRAISALGKHAVERLNNSEK